MKPSIGRLPLNAARLVAENELLNLIVQMRRQIIDGDYRDNPINALRNENL